jgi:hypothetical protein
LRWQGRLINTNITCIHDRTPCVRIEKRYRASARVGKKR